MEEIIRIAANNNFFGLKGKAKYRYNLKNKNCGDEIKIEFDLEKNKLKNFRYEGEICIYCQASASLLSKNTSKLNLKNLSKLKIQIQEYFSENKNKQILAIFDFKKLLKKENKNRKDCISLPINAIMDRLKTK
jgi:nitrogen fixation NifU-like protein